MPLFGPPNVEKLKGKRNVKGLIKALGYRKDAGVRRAAVEALVEIGAPAAKPLVDAFKRLNWKEVDKEVDQAILRALVRIGAPAVEPLLALDFKEFSPRKERLVTSALVRIGAPAVERVTAALDAGLLRGTPYGRAIDLLAAIGDPRAVETLIGVFRRGGWSAAQALGQIGDSRAVEPLIAGLTRVNWEMRRDAAEALGQIGDPRAVEALITTALADKDYRVRPAAVEALGKIGIPAVDPFVAALEHRDKNVRLYAFQALRQSGDARAVEPLIATLQSQKRVARVAAARVLVGMYRSGNLDDVHKRLILAQRAQITRGHKDVRHMDFERSSDCQTHTDTAHKDTGIGLDFPI